MARFQHVAHRLSIVGALALLLGSSLVAGVIAQALTTSAFADTAPYETFCATSPAGNVVLNDVVVTGAMSPASPTPGQQFDVTGVQVKEQLPAAVVQSAEATGLTSLSGTLTTTIDATGATPASITTGTMSFDVALPNPVPSNGVALAVPSTPATVGPFTATSANITVSESPVSNTTDIDGDGIGQIALNCSDYPNDTLPSGFTNISPPGLPISPVIATAGQTTAPPGPPALTGPYELYCPHTPVGDLVLNDVVTTASLSVQNLSAGQQFSVTGYQTHIPLPAGLVSAASGLGNDSFNGLAASAVDAYGASPDQASTGSMPFDVPIPATIPSTGLGVDFPTTPISVGSFTASGGPITIAEDQSTMVVAALSSKAFTMSCTAYPNDSEPTSGSTGTPPPAPPIRPVIATDSASGTLPTTTLAPPPNQQPGTATGPYELYCPGSPVGNLVLNDTTTSATISPSTLAQGQQFSLSNLQTQFSIPQAVAQQAEALGLTQITGSATMFMNTTGVSNDGGGVVTVLAGGSASSVGVAQGEPTTATTFDGTQPIPEPVPIDPSPYQPFPGGFTQVFDMPFNVTLPNPVPATGVQFAATVPPFESASFTAAGGPIEFDLNQINLNVTEFGDSFGLFCSTFPNNTEPTGLSATGPAASPIEPVIATATATITPPPPIGPGGQGPYELYCPGTPVGNITLNDVTTTATLSPADPAPGQQFNVTNFQAQVPLPSSIASAAQALGNTSISGTATITADALGATPASIASGPLSFSTPLPSPIPPSGVTLTVPLAPGTIGPFTATSSSIAIAQNADADLSLQISGSSLDLKCTAYPDNSAPTGITVSPPDTSPISPVIVTAGNPVIPTIPTSPTSPTGPTGPGTPTSGPYELYCPKTPVGNIALNNVVTQGTITPSSPATGDTFNLTGFTTSVALPSSIVAAAAALGNSAITGTAVAKVDATGATPATLSGGNLAIDAPIPSPVPSSGLTLQLPSPAETVGPFTATGGTITLTMDPAISLALDVSGSTLTLTCTPYANNSAATGIVSNTPSGSPIAPIIATTSTGGTGTFPPTTPETVPVTIPPAPSTTLPSTPDETAIAQAFQTLFDPTSTVAQKVAVVEDGSSIEATMATAFSSVLGGDATSGARVDDVTFPDASGCTQGGLISPCASVIYDVLGPNGNALLPNEQGSAVSVNGTWLVSTTTACSLLQLFYQAEGKTGSPPGCPAPGATTATTADPPPAAQDGTGSSTTTSSSTSTTGESTTSTTVASTTSTSGASSTSTSAASTTSTSATATQGTTSVGSSHGSTTTVASPAVQASSGALAFTGLGDVAQWLAVVGGALMLVGFVLLTMADAPRRIRYRLAQHRRAPG